jgi:MerR family transcriptional regulator/heat shock protein HspR
MIEREGLLDPHRTEANIRLYSENDLLLLQRIRTLVSEEGVNLAGVKLILEMESKMGRMTIKYREIIARTQGVSRDSDCDEGDDRP